MSHGTSQKDLLDILFSVLENDVLPKTRSGVAAGNKVFGAAILRKSDHGLVIAETNNETEIRFGMAKSIA